MYSFQFNLLAKPQNISKNANQRKAIIHSFIPQHRLLASAHTPPYLCSTTAKHIFTFTKQLRFMWMEIKNRKK